MININELLKQDAKLTEERLNMLLQCDDGDIKEITDSCRYSVFAGGKRIRPALVIETCKMLDGNMDTAVNFAAAVEMIHTYSLIHDDMPCMDNDALRRGKPTNHVVYGEAIAMLAGDTLLTEAFGVLSTSDTDPYVIAQAVKLLSSCAGYKGMIGGQVMDIYGEKHKYPIEKLLKLHSMKTGALIRASVLLGALAAKKSLQGAEAEKLTAYAEKIGLAFQIVDDMLDCIGDEHILGKQIGNDAEHGKNTFMSFYTVDEAREYVDKLTDDAISSVQDYEKSEALCEIARFLSKRDF